MAEEAVRKLAWCSESRNQAEASFKLSNLSNLVSWPCIWVTCTQQGAGYPSLCWLMALRGKGELGERLGVHVLWLMEDLFTKRGCDLWQCVWSLKGYSTL